MFYIMLRGTPWFHFLWDFTVASLTMVTTNHFPLTHRHWYRQPQYLIMDFHHIHLDHTYTLPVEYSFRLLMAPYVGRFCATGFKNRNAKSRHEVERHTPASRHPCESCDLSFTRLEHLKQHQLMWKHLLFLAVHEAYMCNNCYMTPTLCLRVNYIYSSRTNSGWVVRVDD